MLPITGGLWFREWGEGSGSGGTWSQRNWLHSKKRSISIQEGYQGPGILETGVQQRVARRKIASPAAGSKQGKTPKGSAIWEWQPYGLRISPTAGLQRQDTEHWSWPSTGPRETDVNRLLL